VVVQNNAFNRSRIHTVVVCAITTNLERAQAPGNVLLDQGEANLPRPGVVNVSQLVTVDRSRLRDKAGRLAPERTAEVVRGIWLVIEPLGWPG
jgi:mRNA interferase MazF